MRVVRLTDKQSSTLAAIRDHIKRFGVPPSRTELAKALGIRNQSGVDRLLAALHQKGWSQLLPSVERGIRLLREGAPILDPHELPAVAAGNPVVAEDCTEPPRLHDFDSFTESFESRPDWFVRIERDSLAWLGYRSGDILAVRRDPEPRNGELVVARIGAEVQQFSFWRLTSPRGRKPSAPCDSIGGRSGGRSTVVPVRQRDPMSKMRIAGRGRRQWFCRTEAGTIDLQPESHNPEHEAIRIDANTADFEVIATVVGAVVGTRRGNAA